jgi:carbamoyl-phosphate synthase large subunit
MTQDRLTVLVLGVGGNVSQGILKALAVGNLPCRVIAACVSQFALGLYAADRAYLSPYADDPDFFPWLIDTCRAEGVRAVLSGVEPVLMVLAERKEELEKKTGAVCIVSDLDQYSIGADKLATCQWLERNGLRFPKYAASEDEEALTTLASEYGYPLIAKSRFGKGAREMIRVGNQRDLGLVRSLEGYVVQEHIGDSDSEYTAGCFCDDNGRVRGVIVMRRSLMYGTTMWAEVGEFPEIREEAARIAQALRPRGPCNVQLRLTRSGAVCFEINVRFSGTTPVRVRLGFNEVEAALRHFVLGEPAKDFPIIRSGVVMRYWNEMYISPHAFSTLRDTGRLEDPRRHGLFVEDWGNNR